MLCAIYSKKAERHMFPQRAPSPNTNRLLDHYNILRDSSKPIELTKRPDVATRMFQGLASGSWQA